MKKLSFFGLLILMIATGCHKDLEDVQPMEPTQKVENMSQMKVSDDFSWETTRDIELTVSAATRATVTIKSSEGEVYEKALLVPGEAYNSVLTIPTYEKELTFVFNGKSTVVAISGNKIVQSL